MVSEKMEGYLRKDPVRLLEIGPKGTEGGKSKAAPLEETVSVG